LFYVLEIHSHAYLIGSEVCFLADARSVIAELQRPDIIFFRIMININADGKYLNLVVRTVKMLQTFYRLFEPLIYSIKI
jgi:hypothetical protein